MKNVLIIALLFCAKFASADIVVKKDTVGGYYYCDITPVNCQIGMDTVTRLSFVTFADNNIDNATVAYFLKNGSGVTQCMGNLTISDTTYAEYREICEDGDTMYKAKFIYNYISSQIPQIIPIE